MEASARLVLLALAQLIAVLSPGLDAFDVLSLPGRPAAATASGLHMLGPSPRGLGSARRLFGPRRADGALGAGASAQPGAASDEEDEADGDRMARRARWVRRASGALFASGGAAVVLRRVQPRPVVLVHGVLQSAEFMREVADWITSDIPGTYVRAVEIGNGALDSLTRSMNWQCDELARVLQADPKLARGFNLIGYSQGALLSRGFIERHNRPRVFKFISWMGPQGGQFGVPDWEPLLRHLNWVTSPMWYTDLLQERLSFANYWRDPFRLALYKKYSSFLADINNEREPRNATYASHIRSLEEMVLVYSTNDSIIIPKESGWFAAFAENSSSELVPLEDQQLYKEDWIGLRTLADSKRLHFGVTNCRHDEVTTSACKYALYHKLSKEHLAPPSSQLVSLLGALLPRQRRGNALDGGGGRGGWRGPAVRYDAAAIEREELEMLRRRCVLLSNQLGQLRTSEAALRAELKAAKAAKARRPTDEPRTSEGALRAELEAAKPKAARRPADEPPKTKAEPSQSDAQQLEQQLDEAEARLAAETRRTRAASGSALSPRGPADRERGGQDRARRVSASEGAPLERAHPSWLPGWLRRTET